MHPRELIQWQAFFEIHPFGYERFDILFAMLMSLIANTKRNVKKRKKPFEVADFLPKWRKDDKPEQTPDQMLAFATMLTQAMAEAHGAKPTTPEQKPNGNNSQPNGETGP